MVSGISCGAIIWPHITQLLLEKYGLQGALLIYSAIGLHGLIGASLLRPQLTHHKLTQDHEGAETNNDQKNVHRVLQKSPLFRRICMCMCSYLPFTLFAIGFTLTMCGHTFFNNYTPLRANELGIPAERTAIIMSIIGLMGTYDKINVI